MSEQCEKENWFGKGVICVRGFLYDESQPEWMTEST